MPKALLRSRGEYALIRIGRWLATVDHHARFTGIATKLWSEGRRYGIDPVGLIAQSAKETGYGKYPGDVPAWFNNTCGLKVAKPDQAPNLAWEHATFASLDVGARAHAQHVAAYAGVTVDDLIVDPRFGLVSGPVDTWAQLGAKWAPSSTYGTEIEAMMTAIENA